MTSMETMRWVGNQKHIEKSRPWAPPPRMRLDRGFAGHSFTSFHTIPLTNTIRRFDPPGPADPRFGYGVKNIKDAVGPTIAGVITGENVVKLVAIRYEPDPAIRLKKLCNERFIKEHEYNQLI